MSFGTVTPELEEWLTAHAGGLRVKPFKLPVLGKAKGGGKDRAFGDLVRTYKYAVTVSMDYRTLKEPVSLETFLDRKRSPKYKAWVLPKAKLSLPKLSVKQRALEARNVGLAIASYKRLCKNLINKEAGL